MRIMSTEPSTKDVQIPSDDPSLHPGWALLEYLLSIGADEFAVSITRYGNKDGKDAGDRLQAQLAFAELGHRVRECTVTYGNNSNPRPVTVWRFDQLSLSALRDIMPLGILRSR